MNDAARTSARAEPLQPDPLDDLLCIQCSYLLRGLPSDHPCPECGLPIERSLHGRWLKNADALWLDRVRRGVRRLYLAATILLYVGVPLSVGCGGWGTVVPGYELILAALGAVLLVGLTDLTTVDPRLTMIEQPMTLRRLIRGASLAAVILAPARFAFGLIAAKSPTLPIALIASGLITFLMVAAWSGALSGGLEYMARIAERMPSAALVKETRHLSRRFLSWGAILALGMAGGTAAIPGLIRGPAPSGMQFAVLIASVYLIAPAGIAFCWYIGTMSDVFKRYRSAMERVSNDAKNPAPARFN